MDRAETFAPAVTTRTNSSTRLVAPLTTPATMIHVAQLRPANPVRLTLASPLGQNIDGAWWPRTGRMTRELPELVAVLCKCLGEIVDIKVNWSSLERPPDLNSFGWEGRHQHVMTIGGRNRCANLLIVPHLTSTALAVMVLRRAADLPIEAAHRDTQAFRTADCIVRAARSESAVGTPRLTRGLHEQS